MQRISCSCSRKPTTISSAREMSFQSPPHSWGGRRPEPIPNHSLFANRSGLAMSATVEKTVTVCNPLGIHMRPADLLARAAAQFESLIEIEKDGQSIDCKSIMSILTLGAQQGTQLRLKANGPDAGAAIETLADLIDKGFDETDSEVAPSGKAN